MLYLLKKFIKTLLFLLILSIPTFIWLVSSTTGLKFIINTGKYFLNYEFEIKEVKGTIRKGFTLSNIKYTQNNKTINIGKLSIDFSLSKLLLKQKLKVNFFKIDNIDGISKFFSTHNNKYFINTASGNFSYNIHSNALNMQLENINGTWNNKNLNAKIYTKVLNYNISINKNSFIQLGENIVNIELLNSNKIRWNLKISNLSDFVEHYSGEIYSKGEIISPLYIETKKDLSSIPPSINASFNAKNIKINDIIINQIEANVAGLLSNTDEFSINLNLKDALISAKKIQSIKFNVNGTPLVHKINVIINADTEQLETTFTGKLKDYILDKTKKADSIIWTGSLDTGTIKTNNFANWIIEKNNTFEIAINKFSFSNLILKPCSLKSGSITSTFNWLKNKDKWDINVQGDSIPLEILKKYFPQNTDIIGFSNFNLKADNTNNKLNVFGNLTLPSLDINIKAYKKLIECLNLNSGNASFTLTNNKLDVTANISSKNYDFLNAAVSIDNFDLENFNPSDINYLNLLQENFKPNLTPEFQQKLQLEQQIPPNIKNSINKKNNMNDRNKKINKKQSLNGNIKANFSNLKILNQFIPQISSFSGKLTIDGKLSGTLDAPIFTSISELQNVYFKVPQLGLYVNPLQITLKSDKSGKFIVNGYAKTTSNPQVTSDTDNSNSNINSDNLNSDDASHPNKNVNENNNINPDPYIKLNTNSTQGAKQYIELKKESNPKSNNQIIKINGYFEPFKPNFPNSFTVNGNNILAMNLKDNMVTACPELELSLSNFNKLKITGKIFINNASINLNTLGLEGPIISDDVKFINNKANENSTNSFEIVPDIFVRIKGDCIISGQGLKNTLISGKLKVTKQKNKLLGQGRVSIKKGYYLITGSAFKISRGRLLYPAGTLLTNPKLNIKMHQKETKIKNRNEKLDERIGIFINGTLLNPRIDIKNLNDNNFSSTLLSNAMNIGGGNITKKITSTKLVDEITFDRANPRNSNSNNIEDQQTIIILGKKINKKMYLHFVKSLLDGDSGKPTQKLKMKYNLNDTFTLGLEQGSDGTGAELSFIIEKD